MEERERRKNNQQYTNIKIEAGTKEKRRKRRKIWSQGAKRKFFDLKEFIARMTMEKEQSTTFTNK